VGRDEFWGLVTAVIRFADGDEIEVLTTDLSDPTP
jgi:hypothetical protein